MFDCYDGKSIWLPYPNKKPKDQQWVWAYMPGCPHVSLIQDIFRLKYDESPLWEHLLPYIVSWTPCIDEYPVQPKYRCPCNAGSDNV